VQTPKPAPTSSAAPWASVPQQPVAPEPPRREDDNDDDDGVYFYGAGPTPAATVHRAENMEFPALGTEPRGPACPVQQSSTTPIARLTPGQGAPTRVNRPAADLPQGPSAAPCHFFAKGGCRYGSACRYSHSIAPESEPTEPPEGDMECGICLSPLANEGMSIGILDGCSHLFCLSCIRDWREKGMELSDAQTVRRCPVCRLPSHLVIPSQRIPSSQDAKLRIKQQYLDNLSKIPCRHFTFGVRECPFGSSCFYAHLKPDGTPAPYEAPRIVSNMEGIGGGVTRVTLADFI